MCVRDIEDKYTNRRFPNPPLAAAPRYQKETSEAGKVAGEALSSMRTAPLEERRSERGDLQHVPRDHAHVSVVVFAGRHLHMVVAWLLELSTALREDRGRTARPHPQQLYLINLNWMY